MTTFKFTVNVRGIDQAAERLQRAARRGALILSAGEAVNAVTKRADESLRAGETRDINLTPAYVKSKTDVQLAALGGKPKATIVTKGDLTVLSNFGVNLGSRLISNNAIVRRAGLVAGRRSAGTNVAIRKSQPFMEGQWFVMRLKQGASASEKYGVFVRDDALAPGRNALRDGRAGKRHIYGPSPYALFREQIGVQAGDIENDLGRTASRLMGDELRELLK